MKPPQSTSPGNSVACRVRSIKTSFAYGDDYVEVTLGNSVEDWFCFVARDMYRDTYKVGTEITLAIVLS